MRDEPKTARVSVAYRRLLFQRATNCGDDEQRLIVCALQPIPFAILFRDGNWRRVLRNKAAQMAKRRIEPADERIAAVPGVELERFPKKHGRTPVRRARFLCKTDCRAPN